MDVLGLFLSLYSVLVAPWLADKAPALVAASAPIPAGFIIAFIVGLVAEFVGSVQVALQATWRSTCYRTWVQYCFWLRSGISASGCGRSMPQQAEPGCTRKSLWKPVNDRLAASPALGDEPSARSVPWPKPIVMVLPCPFCSGKGVGRP